MKKIIIISVLVFLAFLLGYFFNNGNINSESKSEKTETVQKTEWTCSMHPQIREPEPGKCPICAMDLIPVSSGEIQTEERQIFLSPNAVKLAEIQTAPVERKFVDKEIRLTGKISYDESRVANITAWVPGRLEKMYVDYTGVNVKKDEHLFYLYSQELYVMQAEYLISRQAGNVNSASGRDRLLLAGLTETQIKKLEQTGKPQLNVTIYSPIGGTVVEKNGMEGMYVEIGTKIYTIADLSKLWLLLDAYESDLIWLRYGQKVLFNVEALPGNSFTGQVVFISPLLDEKTRTIKVRVNVDNKTGILKPGLFAHAIVFSSATAEDPAIDSSLTNKWICPMHPEIIEDKEGKCSICGMDLEHASTFGYSSDGKKPPLVIPASAPLITGKRAVVYVTVPGKKGKYEGREIVLGPRAGDYYIVKSGLKEGEKVVVNGNFKIDSEMQLLAKPSMMNMEQNNHAVPKDENIIDLKNKKCPVMGGDTIEDAFIIYEGKKIYFCCPGCDKTFLQNPEKYLKKLDTN